MSRASSNITDYNVGGRYDPDEGTEMISSFEEPEAMDDHTVKTC